MASRRRGSPLPYPSPVRPESRGLSRSAAAFEGEHHVFTRQLHCPAPGMARRTRSIERSRAIRGDVYSGGSAGVLPCMCMWFARSILILPCAPRYRHSRAAPRTTTVYNSTTVIAPPVMAPPVFGGFGSPFGFSIMPTFVMPVPFLGGIVQVCSYLFVF